VKRVLCLAVVALAAASAAHGAVPPSTSWTRVSGPSRASTQLALLRDQSRLHVVWSQGDPATITDTVVDKNGATLGSTTIASGFDGTGGLALLRMPDGSLRLLATGGLTRGLGSHASGVNSFVQPLGSTTWSVDPTVYGGAVANAADEIGATIAGNGWVFSTWSGAIVHIGFLPSDGDPSYQPECCGADPQLVTDAAGAVYLAWLGNGSHFEGTYVREIWPSESSLFALPSGTTTGSFGLAAPFGHGAYVAYVDAAHTKVQLYQYEGALRTLATGSFQVAKVFRAYGGRLWVMWGSADGGIDVTRSNVALTRFEPRRHLSLPGRTSGFYNAEGEGSFGPLDLFADLGIGSGDRGFWRTHVLPEATLATHLTYERIDGNVHNLQHPDLAHLRYTVTDAGDPIRGVQIRVYAPGQMRVLVTDKTGHAELTIPTFHKPLKQLPGVTASLPGYSIVKQTRGG
jgi:hypothetical protein